jgi:RNA polymerase sigma factor (sigma-70 family)
VARLTEAQREFAERYYPYAKQYARRAWWLLGGSDPGLEQDCLSECHEAIARAALEYDPDGLVAFLLVRHELIKALRRTARDRSRRGLTGFRGGPRERPPHPVFAHEWEAETGAEDEPDLIDDDEYEAIMKPLGNELSKRDRGILWLVYRLGLNGQEAAERAGVSWNVVNKVKARAFRVLRAAHGVPS